MREDIRGQVEKEALKLAAPFEILREYTLVISYFKHGVDFASILTAKRLSSIEKALKKLCHMVEKANIQDNDLAVAYNEALTALKEKHNIAEPRYSKESE